MTGTYYPPAGGLTGMWKVQEYTVASDVNIDSGGYSTAFESNVPTVTGYTPVGVVGFRLTGSNSNRMAVCRLMLSSGKVVATIRSFANNAATVTLNATVLYLKN